MFRVGDRVVAIAEVDCLNLSGYEGTVICVREDGAVGVDFDKDFPSAHDCDGRARHGRWTMRPEQELRLAYECYHNLTEDASALEELNSFLSEYTIK